jgi:hypothetical protein
MSRDSRGLLHPVLLARESGAAVSFFGLGLGLLLFRILGQMVHADTANHNREGTLGRAGLSEQRRKGHEIRIAVFCARALAHSARARAARRR